MSNSLRVPSRAELFAVIDGEPRPVKAVAEHWKVSEWSARNWLRERGLRSVRASRDPTKPLSEPERAAILDAYNWSHSIHNIARRVGLPMAMVPMIREYLREARPKVHKVKSPLPAETVARIITLRSQKEQIAPGAVISIYKVSQIAEIVCLPEYVVKRVLSGKVH